jgi:hypothetical protein
MDWLRALLLLPVLPVAWETKCLGRQVLLVLMVLLNPLYLGL